MVSTNQQLHSEKDWDLSFLMTMIEDAQEMGDDAQAMKLTKRAIKKAELQGDKQWKEKFQAILELTPSTFSGGVSEKQDTEVSNSTDLSQVKGIGPSTSIKLKANGFETIEDMASSTPDQLTRVPGIGESTATKIITNAKDFLIEHRKQKRFEEQEMESSQIQEEDASLTPYQRLKRMQKTMEDPKTSFSARRFDEKRPKIPNLMNYLSSQQSTPVQEETKLAEPFIEENKLDGQSEVTQVMEPFEEKITEETQMSEELKPEPSSSAGEEEKEGEMWVGEEQTEPFGEEEVEIQPVQNHILPATPHQEKKIPNAKDDVKNAPHVEMDTKNVQARETFRVPYREKHYQTVHNGSDLLAKHAFSRKLLKQISGFKMVDIPLKMPQLREIAHGVDHLLCKPIKGDNGRCIVLLVPLKHVRTNDPVFIDAVHVITGVINGDPTLPKNMAINTHTKYLINASDAIREDLVKGKLLRTLISRYIGIRMKVAIAFKNQRLYLGNETIEYQFIVDPLLICDTTVQSLENTLPFAYQSDTNLHVIAFSQVESFMRYMISKYRLLTRHDTSHNAIVKSESTKLDTYKQLQYISFPLMVYGALFCFMLLLGLSEAVRLCISLGFGLAFIYGGAITYLIYRHVQRFRSLSNEFTKPFHERTVDLSEEDLILIADQLPQEWMLQFSYEVTSPRNSKKEDPKKGLRAKLKRQRKTTPSKASLEIPTLLPSDTEQGHQKIISQVDVPQEAETLSITDKYRSFLED